MNVLVTGGAGYLGSILCPLLLNAGHRVHVLDTFHHSSESLALCCAFDQFTVTKGDARDKRTLSEFTKNADIIIPLAAIVGAPACELDFHGAWSTNRGAIDTLVHMLSKDQRIIFPNTNSGYGTSKADEALTETALLKPISTYGKSKVEAEKTILFHHSNSVVFRFATLFGMSPRMRVDLLVNDFVHRAVHDRAVVLFEPHFRRNYLHVRDAAIAFLHAISNPDIKGVYNVGHHEANLTKLQLCERIKQHAPEFVWFESPTGFDPDKRDYIISNAKIAETGYLAQYSLDRGILELIKAFGMLKDTKYGNV